MSKEAKDKDGHWIFRAWITRDGERVWAREYGLKAWRIWVPSTAATTTNS